MLRRLMRRSAAAGDFRRRWMTAGAGGSSKTAVLSFGDGSNGALGLPFSYGADAFEPTRVPGLPSDIAGVAAGHYHSLAVSGDGRVWAWGRNEEGQLGRGVATPRFVIQHKPIHIPPSFYSSLFII